MGWISCYVGNKPETLVAFAGACCAVYWAGTIFQLPIYGFC
ncbi:MAG: hypothetical protein ACLR2G_13260 [Phascolarctobacterium faecium]